MKLNDLYGDVPEKVSRRIEQTVSGLPEKEVNERGIRLSRPLVIALSCVLAVALMTATAIAVGIFTDREEREQRLVDPYAEVISDTTTDNGVTMTIDKHAKDLDMDYIYFTLKNENGVFEKRPEFDVISYTNDNHSWDIESKHGSLLGFTALSSSDYDPDNPSDTIHAVLRTHLPFGKIKLDFTGLNSVDGSIHYADGYSFDIEIGTSEKVADDILEHTGMEVSKEYRDYPKKCEVMDYLITEPDNTIEIEGNKLKISQLYVSPYQVKITVEDNMTGTVKVGELEYYPHTLVTMGTEPIRQMREDDKIRAAMTPEERDETEWVYYINVDNSTKYSIDYTMDGYYEEDRILAEEGQEAVMKYRMEHFFGNTDMGKKVEEIMNTAEQLDAIDEARYEIGIEFAPEVKARIIGIDSTGGTGYYHPENRAESYVNASTRAYIDRAVSIDEIERIYFYKYSDPTVQVDVWVNK